MQELENILGAIKVHPKVGPFYLHILSFLFFSLAAMRNGESTPILDAIVFKKIRALLGGSMRLMLSGGAPLSKETHDFMRVCVGCPILQGYGLTEVAACATVMDMDDVATEQVGCPNQVK